MDFSWTSEQLELRKQAAEFASRVLSPGTRERDQTGTFSKELWRECGDFGIQGSFVPEEYGGRGFDVLTTILMLEGIGYGCTDNGLTLALNGQMWSVQEPILQFGTDEQKQRYLPGLCGGDLFGAHGMTEPESGSDAFSLRTTAGRERGGYLLNGTKTLIGLAPIADVTLVFASTNPGAKQWGISAFLVDHGTPGCEPGQTQQKMGLRAAPMGELHLQDCFVPEHCLLGPEGAGASIFAHSMEWERSFIFASHVGSMERQLEQTIEYCQRRRQFGQPIGKFQAVANRVAQMRVRLETSKLLLYKSAWTMSEGASGRLTSALAKLHLSESFLESSLDAARIHGGRGYLVEHEVERDLRDAVGGVIYSGTSDIQRVLIARLLGL